MFSLFSFSLPSFFVSVLIHSLALTNFAVAFDSITFSRVQQCGNFTVQFAGGQPPINLPLTLTVVPFNLTPISFSVPNSNWNDTTLTGAAITFLPFPAGTDFVAALIDAVGGDAGPVSSIITVDDSEDTSCLASGSIMAQSRYSVNGALAQCAPFDVLYDPAGGPTAPPAVRAFVPGNSSTAVNCTTDAGASAGRATYVMDVPAGQEVILTFTDSTGHHQATGPLLVQGDSQSPSGCLKKPESDVQVYNNMMNMTNGTATDPSSTRRPAPLSKTAIVAIAVSSACAVLVVAAAMSAWFCCERRRVKKRSRSRSHPFNGGGGSSAGGWGQLNVNIGRAKSSTGGKLKMLQLRKPSAGSLIFGGRSRSIRVVRNPPYTDVVRFELVTPSFAKRPPDPPGTQRGKGMVDLEAGNEVEMNEPLSSIPIPVVTPVPPSAFASVASPESAPPLIVEPSPYQSSPRSESGSDEETKKKQKQQRRRASLSSADIAQILETATMFSAPSTPTSPTRPGLGRTSTPRGRGGVKPKPRPTPTLPLPEVPGTIADTNLLTPQSRETGTKAQRDPPQAPIPTSPLASPSIVASIRYSTAAEKGSADGGEGNQRTQSRNLSRFSFYKAERASASDSFLSL